MRVARRRMQNNLAAGWGTWPPGLTPPPTPSGSPPSSTLRLCPTTAGPPARAPVPSEQGLVGRGGYRRDGGSGSCDLPSSFAPRPFPPPAAIPPVAGATGGAPSSRGEGGAGCGVWGRKSNARRSRRPGPTRKAAGMWRRADNGAVVRRARTRCRAAVRRHRGRAVGRARAGGTGRVKSSSPPPRAPPRPATVRTVSAHAKRNAQRTHGAEAGCRARSWTAATRDTGAQAAPQTAAAAPCAPEDRTEHMLASNKTLARYRRAARRPGPRRARPAAR
jgi:hypothetical protein